MSHKLKVPEMGESITEGTIASWRLREGDSFSAGDTILEIETDKITMDVPAPFNGILEKIIIQQGETVNIGDIIATLIESDSVKRSETLAHQTEKNESNEPLTAGKENIQSEPSEDGSYVHENEAKSLSPAVRHLIEVYGIDPGEVIPSGPHGNIIKEDVLAHINKIQSPLKNNDSEKAGTTTPDAMQVPKERREPISRLRKRIAERLVEAQQTAAILTTFNEVDMSRTIEIRSKFKDDFTRKHGISPGFMSFFTLASIKALEEFPRLNASITEDEIIYRDYVNMGIAVGGPKGLVVPVIKSAELMSMAQIELEIARLAEKVKNASITVSDLEGGTFTISNGGVYGSMLSTPILNPPQSGILGMHKIEKRPVVINDEIVIRPMMYLALSYDHRIVDGKEAVQFLVRIKENVESPERMLLDI